MSAFRAPTARRTPISRVRSVTDTSMMFMMPMPPTSSDTAAMLASSVVITFEVASAALAMSSWVRMKKSSLSPGLMRWRWRSRSVIWSTAVFTCFSLAAESTIAWTWVMCRNFRCTVVYGVMSTSSWSSWPFEPFATSVPTTLNGMSLMRIIEPTGSASPNSCFTTLWPSTQTFAAPRTSESVMKTPS